MAQRQALMEYPIQISSEAPVNPATEEAFDGVLKSIENAVRVAREDTQKLQQTVSVEEEKHKALRQRRAQLESELTRLQDMNMNGRPMAHGGATEADSSSATGKFKQLTTIDADLQVHSVAIQSVHNEHRNRIASASWGATVTLFDLSRMAVTRTLGKGHLNQPDQGANIGGFYSVAFAKTVPTVLGCTSCDKKVYLWNHTNGRLLNSLAKHTDEVNGIDFHPLQNVMCTASDDQTAIVWDFEEGVELRVLKDHTKAVYGATFLGSARLTQYYVATCCFDQNVRIFDMRDKQLVKKLSCHSDDVIGIDYSPSRDEIVTGSDDGKIAIWDVRKWEKSGEIDTRRMMPENEVKRVRFNHDGSMLAAACSNHQVLVCKDVGSLEPYAQLTGHSDCVFDVAWSVCTETGKNLLVSASHDKSTLVWREL